MAFLVCLPRTPPPRQVQTQSCLPKAGCLERDGEGEHHDDADVHDVDAPDYDDVGKYDDPDDNDDVVACPITIALTETMMIPVTMTMLLPVAAVFLLRVRRSHYKKSRFLGFPNKNFTAGCKTQAQTD